MPQQVGMENSARMIFGPLQHMSRFSLDNVEQLVDYQMDLARAYTHFALKETRYALDVHDAQSMRHFFDQQTQAAQEFTQEISQCTQRAVEQSLHMTQQVMKDGMQIVKESGDTAIAGFRQTEAAAEQAQRNA